MDTKECIICTETYDNKGQRPIKCIYCEQIACFQCVKTYLLGDVSDIHCMFPNCKKMWNTDFIHGTFPKSFITKELKNHRETVLLEREKALMPDTQPVVERYLEQEKAKKQINTLKSERNDELHDINNHIEIYKSQIKSNKKCSTEVQQWHKKLDALYLFKKERRNYYRFEIYTLQRTINGTNNDDDKKEEKKEEKRKFIRSCPRENCKGFLSTQWKCGLCNTWVCKDCHAIKETNDDPDHKCDMNDVESAKLIKKDSKPCPQCGAMIFRIMGCDQMWCTACNVAFNWRSGKIIKNGTIHNPHYFEWRTQNNIANNQNVPLCGRMPGWWNVAPRLGNTILRPLHRVILEIIDYSIPRYDRQLTTDNQDLRIQYMLNNINEKKLQTLIQQREKRNNKITEIIQLLQMYTQTATELFIEIINHTPGQNNEYVFQLCTLTDYANKSLYNIAKRWDCIALKIQPNIINNNNRGLISYSRHDPLPRKTWEYLNSIGSRIYGFMGCM